MEKEFVLDVVKHYHRSTLNIAHHEPIPGVLLGIDDAGNAFISTSLHKDRSKWREQAGVLRAAGAKLLISICETRVTRDRVTLDALTSCAWVVGTQTYVMVTSVTWDWEFWVNWCGDQLRPRPFEPMEVADSWSVDGFRFETEWVAHS